MVCRMAPYVRNVSVLFKGTRGKPFRNHERHIKDIISDHIIYRNYIGIVIITFLISKLLRSLLS